MERFFQVPNEIFEITALTIYHKMVLIYLFRAGNQGSPIFPSYKTIAMKCGMSRAKAIQVVNDLQGFRIIDVKLRKKGSLNNSNLYSIDRKALMDLIIYDADHSSTQDSPPLVNEVDPIKNHLYKEPSKNTHSLDGAPTTLSFSEYKKQFGENKDPEDIKAVEFFVEYKKAVHGEHKKMKLAAWNQAVEDALDLYEYEFKRPVKFENRCLWDEFTALVVCYFNKIGEFHEPCDYSISHFNSPYIKAILIEEAFE